MSPPHLISPKFPNSRIFRGVLQQEALASAHTGAQSAGQGSNHAGSSIITQKLKIKFFVAPDFFH